MSYKVEKGSKGRQIVSYQCPNCREPLQSPLEDAGNKERCPTCRQSLVVPGEAELMATYRQQAEESRQAEAARLAEIQRSAAAKLAADIQAQAHGREKAAQWARARAARERQRAALGKSAMGEAVDRFLGWAFSFGKAVSVLVIAGCFATIAFAFVGLMGVTETPPRTAVPPLAAPGAADYRQYLQPVGQSPADTGSADSGSVASPGEQQDRLFPKRFVAAARQFGLSNSMLYEIRSEIVGLGQDYWEPFVAGLERFAQDLKAAGQPLNEATARWYVQRFAQMAQERAVAERRRDQEQAVARAVAEGRRAYLLTIIGGAIAALLTFLFLPLLIQIEQNTRLLLLHEAAGRGDAAPDPARVERREEPEGVVA